MNCLRCNAPLDLTKPACAACGTKVDADGDGVPDVLGKMIEDKARALFVAEKQREQEQAAEASRIAAQQQADTERDNDRRTLHGLYSVQDTNASTPRRVWYLSMGWIIFFGILSAIVGGILCPACVEPMVGRSFFAGKFFCSTVCATCRGPGRIFTWSETTNGDTSNVSTQLCHNATVDIDRLGWMDVTDRQDEDLKPYRLTLWSSVPVDFLLVYFPLLLVGPFFAGRMRTKSLERERRVAKEAIARLEARLGVAPRPPPDAPYR
jgi:hypothetical protein